MTLVSSDPNAKFFRRGSPENPFFNEVNLFNEEEFDAGFLFEDVSAYSRCSQDLNLLLISSL